VRLGLSGFKTGQVLGGGECLGCTDALVDGHGLLEAGDRGLCVGVCLAASDSFKGVCLIQRAADLTRQAESLLDRYQAPAVVP